MKPLTKKLVTCLLVAFAGYFILCYLGHKEKADKALEQPLILLITAAVTALAYLLFPKEKAEPLQKIDDGPSKSLTIQSNPTDPYQELYEKLTGDYNRLWDWGTETADRANRNKNICDILHRRQRLFHLAIIGAIVFAFLSCVTGLIFPPASSPLPNLLGSPVAGTEKNNPLNQFIYQMIAYLIGGGMLGAAIARFMPAAEPRHAWRIGLFTPLLTNTIATLVALPYIMRFWGEPTVFLGKPLTLNGHEIPVLLSMVSIRLAGLPTLAMLTCYVMYAVVKTSIKKKDANAVNVASTPDLSTTS